MHRNRTASLDAGLAEPLLPRSNGTLAFDEPWQGRAFAIAILLVEGTGHKWEDFRCWLIDAIADRPNQPYWDTWVTALEHFVQEIGSEI